MTVPQNSNLELGMSKVWRKKKTTTKKGCVVTRCKGSEYSTALRAGLCDRSRAARWGVEERSLLGGMRCHTDLGTALASTVLAQQMRRSGRRLTSWMNP